VSRTIGPVSRAARKEPRAAVERDDRFDVWALDFTRRLGLRDEAIALLAEDVAARTGGTVRARGVDGFDPPLPGRTGEVDVCCTRDQRPPFIIEVELLETLVRRPTLRGLRLLVGHGLDTRVALVADPRDHDEQIASGERLLRAAGLRVGVVAVSPPDDAITGADW
jgi:hypothetical protein